MIDLITGHYIINFYCINKTLLKSLEAQARNLEYSKKEAAEIINKSTDSPRPIYFTIDRRIINSTDEK